ncbi:baculoviral IAP repeat-containing protein 7-like [Liolophura sinensis]|uniref:baculoviral IAP repeat-containing protein 7-like n=1 Tax=Liolophura sinensis TaxID=3198878 RepID=UPI003158A0A5
MPLGGNTEHNLKREEIRLRTFINWPSSSLAHPILLAQEGFYYSGQGDTVTCYSCKREKSDWKAEEIPSVTHRLLSPSCPIVTGTAEDNVPITPPSDASVAEALLSWLQQGQTTFDSTLKFADLLDTIMQNTNGNRSRMTSRQLNSSVVTDAMDELDMESNEMGCEVMDITDERLVEEEFRLSTFVNWPQDAPVHPRDLAKAGFYYTDCVDRVKCVFCKGILRNWEEGDDAMAEHRSHFPNCPFIKGDPTDNVPLSNAGASTHVVMMRWTDDRVLPDRPRHPEFESQSTRVSSFTKWPPNKKQRPQELATAGFYYAGYGDNVKCFFCDGGLRNWEPQDDPWTEHGKWFPRCGYVLKVKGNDFVNSAQATNSPSRGPGTGLGVMLRTREGSSTTGGLHHIEPRQVNARMDTPTVQAVLSMGYSRDKIKKVIQRRLQTTGDDFPNAASLMEAVFNLEEEEETQSGSSQTSRRRPAQRHLAQNANSATSLGSDVTGANSDIVEEAHSLLEENRMLREEMTCKICMDRESSVVFLPCGHLVCCTECAPALTNCPICRATIKGSVRTFMS